MTEDEKFWEKVDQEKRADMSHDYGPMKCPWCFGCGYILVEPNSSPSYKCTDCGGTGRVYDKDTEE